MQCRSTLARLDPLRTGELTGEEVQAVSDHLSTCESCHDSVEDLQSFAASLRNLGTSPVRSCLPAVTDALCDSFDAFEVGGQTVHVAFSSRGITRVDLHEQSPEEFAASYTKRFGRELRRSSIPSGYRTAIEQALRGEATTLPEIDISRLSEFEQQVLRSIVRIPHGEARTYEWVAREVGRPKAVRAIGNVMASNPVPFLLPCHRVLPSSGGIGNYGYGPEMKRRLLAAEDVPVEELEQLARAGVRYLGSRTTKIFCFPTCHAARRIQEANRMTFHNPEEARRHGYRPCKRCSPALAA